MSAANTLDVSAPSDREIVLTRVVDAPKALVFDAFTKPDLIKRWLYGPEEWPLVHCEIDLKVGGALRYVWRHREKGEMAMGGVFREIVPLERIVHTEIFDEDWTGGEALVTTVFSEKAGGTTVTMTILYSSREARDGVLKSGMADGMNQSYGRLDRLLGSFE